MIDAGLENSNPSESESSINDYDSFSNEDMQLGGEMGSQDLPWQQTNSGPPETEEEHGEEGGTEDDMVFPMRKFLILMDGLLKLPSWTVYPIHMSSCLSAACRILQDDSRCSAAELTLVQRLIREGVPSAFEKCLNDQALYKWSDDIHLNILDSVLRLVDLVAVKLTLAKDQDAGDMETEDDLLPLLRALATAVDKSSCFNDKHSTDPTPIDSDLEEPFALPLSWVSAGVEEMDDGAEKVVTERFSWLASVVNYVGSKGAFDALLEVLGKPEQFSINLLRAMMCPISLAAEFLVPVALHPFGQACQGVLVYISELLENDIEELSSRGADKSYSNTSQLLAHIYDVLEKSDGAEEANKYVGKVQCAFIKRMLNFSNFNKNLSAVRETSKLLKRSEELKALDGGIFMRAIFVWLENQKIVKAMLRGSLHQKQYVDQVQHILQFLLRQGCMTVEHLDTLWAVTEKADTFETVKNNIYSLLVELAFDFSPEQLDMLFVKFDGAKDRPSADRIPIAQLLEKIAQADMQGVMAERIVDLLWNIVTAPDAPMEVVRRGMLVEVALVYEARGLMLREKLCLRCFEMVKNRLNASRGLYLLRQLVNVDGHDSQPLKLAALMEKCGAQELLISSLEEVVQTGSASTEETPRSLPSSISDGKNEDERIRGISERVNMLLFLFQRIRQKLPLHSLERLWTCLIACPATKQDQELGYLFFREGLASNEQVIDASTASRILQLWIPQQKAQDLSEAGYSFIHNYFCTVNLAAEKLCQKGDLLAREDIQLEGLDYLWQIALSASHSRVSNSACALLIAIHTNFGPRLEPRAEEVRNYLLEECVRNYLSAGKKLLNVELSVNVDDALSALNVRRPPSLSDTDIITESRRAARCVTILVDMIERSSSRSMPRVHSHAAAYVYNTLRLEINCTLPKGPAQRFSIGVAGSDYVGLLRQLVAKRLAAEPARVRLLCAGHELSNDSKMIRQIGIGDGHVITAAVSDVPNSYSQPQVESGSHDQSVVDVITASKTIYPLLLCLSDSPYVCADARQSSMTMLQALPTWQAVSKNLIDTLASDNPANSLHQLLFSSGPAPNMWLLYRIQALLGLLSPAGTGAHLPPNMPERSELVNEFLRSGCLSVVLNCAALPIHTEREGVEDVGEKQQSETCITSQLSQLAGCIVVLLRNLIYPSVKQTSLSDTAESESIGAEAQTVDLSMTKTTISDVELDGPTIRLMVHRIMGIAWAAGCGWRVGFSRPYVPSSDERHERAESSTSSVPSDQDQGVVSEALRILVRLAAKRSEAVPAVISFPYVERFIIDGLFNRYSQAVRTNTVHALLQIFCSTGSPKQTPAASNTVVTAEAAPETCTCWLLKLLASARGLVDSHHDICGEYFQLLLGCLPHCTDSAEVKVAEMLLASEIQKLQAVRGPIDESDVRLVGQLNLVLALVQALNKQSIGASSQGGLVELLIKKLLFPEAVWLQRMAQHGTSTEQSSSVGGPVYLKDPELTASLHAPCDSEKTRAAALELLTEIMSGDSTSLTEGVRLLMELHYSSDPQWDFEHQPSFHRRVQQRYCGLKNAGATCYMNATIQQLFMTTGLRRLLLGVQDVPDESKSDSVLYQLQVTFAHLALSSLNFYVPRHFWRAFKDYDGEPVNLREHQDAFEFLTRLQDLVDQNLSDARQDKVMKNIMGGKFAQQVICRGVSYRSETEQDFMGISVDVRGKRNLLESLTSYVQGELMEGENAYYCEEVGRKVDAVKRACVKALPNTLIIHLKRFEFDFETMLRWKIRDRFEFPTHLDMYEYTVEGLAEAEGTTDKQTPPTRPPEYYQYELVGIVVHSGTAFAGHYYSYIKERAQAKPDREDESSQAGSLGTWWSFDDNNVEPWDPAQMDRDCFGGKSAMEVLDNVSKQHVLQEFDRPNSAYLLVYERRKPLSEKASTTGSSAVDILPPSRESGFASPMAGTGSKESSGCDRDVSEAMLESASKQAAEEGVSGQHENYVTLDVPGIGPLQIQQSVYKDVMEDNLHMMDEMHRLDRDYLHFVRTLIEVLSDLSHWDLSKRKLRRTEHASSVVANPSTPGSGGVRSMLCDDHTKDASSPGAGVAAELSASSISEPRELQAGRQAVVGMKLATSFLLKVYMRAHQSLRDDMSQWRSSMLQMMGASPAANLVFLQTVCQSTCEGGANWLNCYLVMCPSTSVRTFFASLLADSLRCAVTSQGAAPDVLTQPKEGSLAAAVDQLLDALLELTCLACESNSIKTPVAQLFHVLYCYARLSSRCFNRLLASSALLCNAADVASRLYHLHFTQGSISMDEHTSLFGLLGLAVRHSDMLEGAENPHALVPAAEQFPMPVEAAKFLSSEKFLTALVELYLQHQDAAVTIQGLTWDNPGLSHSVLQILLDWLSACPVEDLFLCMEHTIALITVNDQFQWARIRLMMSGLEGLHGSLRELIHGQGISDAKRYSLICLTAAIGGCVPPEKVQQEWNATPAVKREWQDVYKWLEHSSPSVSQAVLALPPSIFPLNVAVATLMKDVSATLAKLAVFLS